MELIPLKSHIIKLKSNLAKVISRSLQSNKAILSENDILIISSKVVSISEGELKDLKSKSMAELINKEAEYIFDKNKYALTLKEGILIPNAGIDQSNVPKGKAVLYPKNPQKSADKLKEILQKQLQIKKLGILIIDSCCHPLRKGVSGVALAYSGFEGVQDCRGKKDIFGNTLKVTQRNLADCLASAALVLTGEADEKIPFVIARNTGVKFTNRKVDSRKKLVIAPKHCLFSTLYPAELLKKK